MLLTIMVGVPGSGKSTKAQELARGSGVILSTDAFFYVDGEYRFDRTKLGEYHERNRELCEAYMQEKHPHIIIDNTNTTAKERKPYADLARQYGYEVDIVEPDTPWKYNPKICATKNAHNVPEATIDRMLNRLMDDKLGVFFG